MTEYGPGLVPTNWYNSRYMMIKLRSGARFRQKRCIRCYFFEENVNGVNYLDMLKYFFWPKHLQLDDAQKYYFQQDGAPPHRKKEVQTWLKDKFGKKFLDASIWPPRSPDLNPCDFSLWGTLKKNVYNPKPLNIQELRENI